MNFLLLKASLNFKSYLPLNLVIKLILFKLWEHLPDIMCKSLSCVLWGCMLRDIVYVFLQVFLES